MTQWQAIFKVKSQAELKRLKSFLKERLISPYGFFTSGLSIIITSPSEDGCFKVGQLIRYQNALGRALFYAVKCVDEFSKQTLFDSGCKTCRSAKEQGKPHLEHFKHCTKIEGPSPHEETLSIVRLSGGKVTLPKEAKVRYNLKDGDKFLVSVNGKRITLTRINS